MRAWAFLEGMSTQEVFTQIMDAKARNKWDTVLADFQVVDQLEDGTEVIYFIIKVE